MPYKMIDLFAGCGGLEDGFLQSGRYEDIAAVEWLQPQVKTLINRLETKWGMHSRVLPVMSFVPIWLRRLSVVLAEEP